MTDDWLARVDEWCDSIYDSHDPGFASVGRDLLYEATEALRVAGVVPAEPATHDTPTSAYWEDPDYQMTHQPDAPFGCTATWGQAVHFEDMGIHVCNKQSRHVGVHECKCGSTYGEVPAT